MLGTVEALLRRSISTVKARFWCSLGTVFVQARHSFITAEVHFTHTYNAFQTKMGFSKITSCTWIYFGAGIVLGGFLYNLNNHKNGLVKKVFI